MSTPPEPALLYPDIAAAGSLGSALRAAAAGLGIDLEVQVTASSPLMHAVVPSTQPHRAPMIVSGWSYEPQWSVSCREADGLPLLHGVTRDLGEIARLGQAWRAGVPLSGIAAVAPFVRPSGRFEVPDRDPSRVIASEWQHMLTDAAEAEWPEYRSLVTAAYAEPRLQALYPYTSHYTMRFSPSPRPRLGDVPFVLEARRDGTFAVRDAFGGDLLLETGSAAAAVDFAVRRLG